MARLVYCETCRATYPLIVAKVGGGRSGKTEQYICPMGHSEVREVDEAPASRA
jgi:hypothetical protein